MFHQFFSGDFPFWEFLNQRVFDPESKLILNPSEFCKHQQVDLLERCLSLSCQNRDKYPFT